MIPWLIGKYRDNRSQICNRGTCKDESANIESWLNNIGYEKLYVHKERSQIRQRTPLEAQSGVDNRLHTKNKKRNSSLHSACAVARKMAPCRALWDMCSVSKHGSVCACDITEENDVIVQIKIITCWLKSKTSS